MKKGLFLSVVVCLFSITAQAQSCDPEYLSISGLSHYNKSMEYIEHLDLGTHEKAVEELEALIKTDSLWCDGVYNQLGYLCELLYNGSKNDFNKRQKYFNKAVNYYKVYLGFNPNDRIVIEKVSSLEAQLDIAKNSINNSIKIEMVYVEGMLNEDTTDCIHSFYIGRYEVTQAQWEEVMGSNPSNFKGPNLPVENISFYDVQLFINELNRLTGNNYRLPTEKEWEYAMHGGKAQEKYTYSGGYSAEKVGWLEKNSSGRTHPVGQKEPNSLGIYDMTGNVAELCIDEHHYEATDYSHGNPKRVEYDYHIAKGGCWLGLSLDHVKNQQNSDYIGIRLIQSISESFWSEMDSAMDSLIGVKRENEANKKLKQKKWDSFFPIMRSDGNWVDVNIGYNFDSKTSIAYATISPGPIYASVMAFDSASFFYSAGASLKIINRFNLRLGLAYSAQNNLFGMDVGLGKQWKKFGVSGGALLFQYDEIIPHFEIECYKIKAGALRYKKQIIPTLGAQFDMSKSKWKSKWEFNISSIYGYDFKDKYHLMGLTGFYAPFYVSGMYQTDKNYCVTIGGVSTIFDSECWGVHGALAYSSSDNFGIDIGLTYSGNEDGVALGNLSVGALIYKDKIIPTVGLGGAGGFGALGIAGIIAAAIWGGYELYMRINNN